MDRFRIGLLVAGLAACGIASGSTTVTVTGVDMSRGQNIYFLEDGTAVQGYAGAIVVNANNASTSVLCVDLFTNINLNDVFQVNFLNPQYLDPTNTAAGLRAAYLFVTQFGTISSYLSSQNPSITLAQATAALQLAIWDIVHDGGDGFSAGRIRSSSVPGQSTDAAVLAAAIQYVQFSLNYQDGPTNATLWRHVDGPQVKQQLIGFYQPGTENGIPEPGTSFLIACGLGLLGWRHYAHRKGQRSE
jgi:hypothetical protein